MSGTSFLRLARHIALLVGTGQLRFRAETFGLYYPAPQYAAPWWRVSPTVLALLLRRTRSYARWLDEMEMIARSGGSAWWETRGIAEPRSLSSGGLPHLWPESHLS